MKRKIVVSIILSFIGITAMAQTNYYPNTTGTITKTGYTYKYRAQKIADYETTDRLELYNATNPFLNTEWAYKDGSQMPFAERMGQSNVKDISDSSQTIAETLAMVDGFFTQQQKTALKGESMFIDLRINPLTGSIGDVYFSFLRNSPFVNIPVETYRNIELALKQNLSVTVTPDGRKLTYIQLFWSQEF